jgi:hypothetical protein
MNNWNDVAHWAFGRGFWYTDAVEEVEGLTKEQLFWVPTPKSLCALWHIGHIAHRERLHLGQILQGHNKKDLIPEKFEIFGIDWCSAETVRKQFSDPQPVMDWFKQVRQSSHEYISHLSERDFLTIPPSSEEGTSVAQVLFQTVAHTALHIGRIQMIRAMIENKNERAC